MQTMASTNVTRNAGAPRSVRRMNASKRPVSCAKPMDSIMTMTRPRGAKLV